MKNKTLKIPPKTRTQDNRIAPKTHGLRGFAILFIGKTTKNADSRSAFQINRPACPLKTCYISWPALGIYSSSEKSNP